MDINQLEKDYLENYFIYGNFQAELSFRTALAQSRLDHTMDSLDRIDALLSQIRTRFALDDFLQNTANQNFLRLLGFYLVAVLKQQATMVGRWYNYAETMDTFRQMGAAEAADFFPDTFENSMNFVAIGFREIFPLQILGNRLYARDGNEPIRSAAQAYLRRGEESEDLRQDVETQLRQNAANAARQTQQIAEPAPLEIVEALKQAGTLAAMSFQSLSAGDSLMPAMFSDKEILVLPGNAQDSVPFAQNLLTSNPKGAKFQVLAFDGLLRNDQGKTDALIIEARTYQAAKFSLTLGIHYTPASAPTGFAIRTIQIMDTNLDNDALSGLFNHFLEGTQHNPEAGKVWNRYRVPKA